MEKGAVSVPSNNPSTYCRLCFMIGDRNLVALFPTDSEPRHFLIEQIAEFTGIQIRSREDAYDHICWRCAVALEDFQLFRLRSLEHDDVIRSANISEIKVAGNRFTILEHVGESGSGVSSKRSRPKKIAGSLNSATNVTETTQIQTSAPKLELNEDSHPSNQISNENCELSSSSSSDEELSESLTKTYNCHICKTEFGTQHAMFAHFREQHSDRGRPHKCTLCPAAFKRKTHLEDHVSSHLGELRYVCKDCGAKYAKAKSLLRHRKIYHAASLMKSLSQHTPKSKEDPQFKCPYCPKAFKHRPSLNFHIKSHYELLNYVCEICDARFANLQGISIHKGKYHPQNPADKLTEETKLVKKTNKCDYCPRQFKNQSSLTAHVNHMHYTAWRQKLADEQKQMANENHSDKVVPMEAFEIKVEND